MKNLLKLVLCSALLAAGAAHASLVKNGAVITDTSSQLDWMPLSATTGLDYQQMLLAFGDRGSMFYGYEYATLHQVEALFTNDGYAGSFDAPVSDPASMDALRHIFGLFGQTGSDCCARGDGVLKGSDATTLSWLYYIPDLMASGSGVVVANEDVLDPYDYYWAQTPDNLMGSWIVKQHADAAPVTGVPAPGSLALMALAFGALAAGRRKPA